MAQGNDVFISYKREERGLTKPLIAALRKAGFVAVTDENIPNNKNFSDEIDAMIRRARLTLVLWTKASAGSDWVRQEARLARDLKKAGKDNNYFGVMVEDVALDLPVDLRGGQMETIYPDGLTAENVARVVAVVQDMLKDTPQKSPEQAESISNDHQKDLDLFQMARSLDVVSGYELYLRTYPQGQFAADARRAMAYARRWYLHPFRRANLPHTLATISILVMIGGVVWGARAQQPITLGVPQATHDAALTKLAEQTAAHDKAQKDLSQKQAALQTAEAEVGKLRDDLATRQAALQQAQDALAQAGAQADTLTTAKKNAEAQATEAARKLAAAQQALQTAQTEAGKLRDDLATRQAALQQAQDALAQAGAQADTLTTAKKNAEAQATEAARKLAAAQQALKTAQTEAGKLRDDLAVKTAQAAKPKPDCTENGKPGFKVLDRCIAADATDVSLSYTDLSDLTPLAGLLKLKTLFVYNTQVNDLSPLAGLSKLERLYASGTQVNDLSPLAGLTNLEALSVSGTQVNDLSPLAGLSNLERLYVYNMQASDLSPLASLSKLRTLWTPDGRQHEGRDAVRAAIRDWSNR